jgi:hypothetical protein
MGCLALGGLGALSFTRPAAAASLDDIRQLEALINAAGVVTLVSDQCPPRHAGYYDQDGRGGHQLVSAAMASTWPMARPCGK